MKETPLYRRIPSNSSTFGARRAFVRAAMAGLVSAGVFGAVGGGASVAQERLESHRRFQPPERPGSVDDLARGLAGELRPVGQARTLALAVDEKVRIPVDVVRGVCYAVAGVSATIGDLDVWVWDGDELVAQDVDLDAWPVARWCAARTATVQVEWVAFDGTGLVDWLLLVDPESEAALGRRDELSNRLDVAISRTAPRFVPIHEQHRGVFRAPGTTHSAVRVIPGCCHAIVGVGEAFVEDWDLRILATDGAEVTADRALGPVPSLLYCAPSSARAEITVEAALLRGYGGVAFQALVEPACPRRHLVSDEPH